MYLSDYPSLKANTGKINLMTHLVAGYPDIETNKKLIETMAKNGVSIIEIQIPFSDPLADGPTIMRANQSSLERGIDLDTCFSLMRSMSKSVDIPLLFMTYGNIPFTYGLEAFVDRSLDSGCSGFIIPDLPYDEDTALLNLLCHKKNVPNVAVVSPDTPVSRLEAIKNFARGFIYTTLKVGVTGTMDNIDSQAVSYVQSLRQLFDIPIAAGFGISKPEQIHSLVEIADIAVIGSKIIEIVERHGVNGVENFIKDCLSINNSGDR